MKRGLLFATVFAACIAGPVAGHAQTNNVQWAKHYGGTGGATAQAVTTDAAGNIYCTGYFYYGLTLDNVNLTSAGLADVVVKKTDPNGNVLWAKNFGGGGNDFGFNIVNDASGNVYVSGTFRNTATFGTVSLTAVDVDDILVMKIDGATGNVIWAKGFGTTGDDGAPGLAVDASGNVYIAGYYGGLFTGGSATFGTTTLTSKGGRDVFVAKLNSTGDVVWAESMGGTIGDEGASIALNSTGDIYLTGIQTGVSTFGTVTLTSLGMNDAFVAKMDNAGVIQWAKNFGGTNLDAGRKIVVDKSDKVYVSGLFFGTASFGTNSFTSAGNADMYLMKLDASGSIEWAKQYGSTVFEETFGLSADKAGNVYIAGMMEGATSFGTTSLTPVGSSDVFAAKVEAATGNTVWAFNFGGPGNEYGRAITADSAGTVILYGEHNSEFPLGKDSLKHYKGRNFLAKITGAVSTGVPGHELFSTFNVYPNPAGDHITIPGLNVTQVCVYNAAMQKQSVDVEGNTINISNLPAGLYYVYASSGSYTGIARFIKQ